jgi:hypothetical protein
LNLVYARLLFRLLIKLQIKPDFGSQKGKKEYIIEGISIRGKSTSTLIFSPASAV